VDPAQFLVACRKKAPLGAGYALLGDELFSRDGCRQALVEAALPPQDRQAGLVEFDLGETSLDRVIAEARTLSLFAPSRLIVAYNAEAVLGRGAEAADDEQGRAPAAAGLEAYFERPTPGVVLLFEALRFNWDDRDEKKKLERLAKFFAAVPVKIELKRLNPRAALEGARRLAEREPLAISEELLAELAEALGYDMGRIAGEIRKLAVYSGGRQQITRQTLAELVPEARTSGLFELTDVLGAKNRLRALEILDNLTRMDVYLPLQVNFLAGLFRYALAVKEAGARNPGEAMRLFNRLGVPIWPARAQQAVETAARFTRQQLEGAVFLLFATDRDLRRDRPDDRIIMERLVWELTAGR